MSLLKTFTVKLNPKRYQFEVRKNHEETFIELNELLDGIETVVSFSLEVAEAIIPVLSKYWNLLKDGKDGDKGYDDVKFPKLLRSDTVRKEKRTYCLGLRKNRQEAFIQFSELVFSKTPMREQIIRFPIDGVEEIIRTLMRIVDEFGERKELGTQNREGAEQNRNDRMGSVEAPNYPTTTIFQNSFPINFGQVEKNRYAPQSSNSQQYPQQLANHQVPGIYQEQHSPRIIIERDSLADDRKIRIVKFLESCQELNIVVYHSMFFRGPNSVPYDFDLLGFVRYLMSDAVKVTRVNNDFLFELI